MNSVHCNFILVDLVNKGDPLKIRGRKPESQYLLGFYL